MLTYHIITIGCQMNKSDSERLAAVLEKQGYRWRDNKYGADLVAVNTCGVRQSAENRIYGLIPRIKKENSKAKIILTGCLVARPEVKRRLKKYVDMWLPIHQISNFKFQISNQCQSASRRTNVKCQSDYLEIRPKYQSKFSAFVPIGNGCDNFCSYCVVPYARGREVYRQAEDILAEVRGLVKRGYREITLVAQNVNSYHSKFSIFNFQFSNKSNRNTKYQILNTKYKDIDFADLLKMINDIPGHFWIRFVASHPKDMSDKLIKTIAQCEKVVREIHLPAQSGDDEILKKMNRKYKARDYVNLIKKIRKNLDPTTLYPPPERGKRVSNMAWRPPVAITTDIIAGFPGETRKQFNNTAKTMRQVGFDMAYLAQYSPRPGTAAAKLPDDVPAVEKKRREQVLNQILKKTALKNNKVYLGKIVLALVDGMGENGRAFGRTETGKNVVISQLKNKKISLIGKFIKVKIIKARDFGLEGEIT